MDERQEHFDALLAGYVAGTLAEPARLLVRSHLDLSPVNRGFVRDLEATCGSMLEGVAPMPLENRDAMLAAIFDTPLGRLGGLLCWEHEMTLVKNAMYARGEQVQFVTPYRSKVHLVPRWTVF